MDPKSEKPLRLFVNPFTIWTDLALKTGEVMLASAHAAAARANAPKVAVIPTADAPPPKAQAPAAEKAQAPAAEPVRHAAKPAKHISKAARFKAARTKVRSKANAKRRAGR
jgi:hypothetical protein